MDVMVFRLNGSVVGSSKPRWVVRASGKDPALVVQPGKASSLALPLAERPQAIDSVLLGPPSLLYKGGRAVSRNLVEGKYNFGTQLDCDPRAGYSWTACD